MKIIQILPTVAFGDAVSNDTIALKNLIKSLGYQTGIYAENIDKRLDPQSVLSIDKIPHMNSEDIIIYHESTGTKLSYAIPKFNCRKIMIYHNITPPKYFHGYNSDSVKLTSFGLEGASFLRDKIDYCLADSEFNKQCLVEMGYKCKIDVLPILIPFDDYSTPPDEDIINKYNDGKPNILFVGRIAPNKKQEDIIKSFYYYKKYINSEARLFFVGSYQGMESYYERLCDYVEALELTDVYFTGHIKFNQILSYYKIADAFVCMSEHEGFCVPLIEAMYFNVPIIAYSSSAIPYTLGGSGILVNDKDPKIVAELINKVVIDKNLKEEIIAGQKKRIEYFCYNRIKDLFIKYLNNFIGVSH